MEKGEEVKMMKGIYKMKKEEEKKGGKKNNGRKGN